MVAEETAEYKIVWNSPTKILVVDGILTRLSLGEGVLNAAWDSCGQVLGQAK